MKKYIKQLLPLLILVMSLSITADENVSIEMTVPVNDTFKIVEEYLTRYEAEKSDDMELYNPYNTKTSETRLIVKEGITVYDGDTIKYRYKDEGMKVRLIGIDAPELKQEDGQLSKDCLLDLINEDGPVFVEMFEADKYGRTLGRLIRSDDDGTKFTDINKAMIVRGCSWYYPVSRYLGKEEDKVYSNLFLESYTGKTGMFAAGTDMKPSDYRASKRKPAY